MHVQLETLPPKLGEQVAAEEAEWQALEEHWETNPNEHKRFLKKQSGYTFGDPVNMGFSPQSKWLRNEHTKYWDFPDKPYPRTGNTIQKVWMLEDDLYEAQELVRGFEAELAENLEVRSNRMWRAGPTSETVLRAQPSQSALVIGRIAPHHTVMLLEERVVEPEGIGEFPTKWLKVCGIKAGDPEAWICTMPRVGVCAGTGCNGLATPLEENAGHSGRTRKCNGPCRSNIPKEAFQMHCSNCNSDFCQACLVNMMQYRRTTVKHEWVLDPIPVVANDGTYGCFGKIAFDSPIDLSPGPCQRCAELYGGKDTFFSDVSMDVSKQSMALPKHPAWPGQGSYSTPMDLIAGAIEYPGVVRWKLQTGVQPLTDAEYRERAGVPDPDPNKNKKPSLEKPALSAKEQAKRDKAEAKDQELKEKDPEKWQAKKDKAEAKQLKDEDNARKKKEKQEEQDRKALAKEQALRYPFADENWLEDGAIIIVHQRSNYNDADEFGLFVQISTPGGMIKSGEETAKHKWVLLEKPLSPSDLAFNEAALQELCMANGIDLDDERIFKKDEDGTRVKFVGAMRAALKLKGIPEKSIAGAKQRERLAEPYDMFEARVCRDGGTVIEYSYPTTDSKVDNPEGGKSLDNRTKRNMDNGDTFVVAREFVGKDGNIWCMTVPDSTSYPDHANIPNIRNIMKYSQYPKGFGFCIREKKREVWAQPAALHWKNSLGQRANFGCMWFEHWRYVFGIPMAKLSRLK